MSERLTEEQVSAAVMAARGHGGLIEAALLQVSADLSAAKADIQRLSLGLFERSPKNNQAMAGDAVTSALAFISALQKAARAAAVVIGRAHGLLDCRTYPKSCGGQCPECLVASDLDVASSAIRSLLPEERTQEDHDEGHAEHLANEGRTR